MSRHNTTFVLETDGELEDDEITAIADNLHSFANEEADATVTAVYLKID